MSSADWSRQPRQVGRYPLLKELGRGGAGVVYLGLDPDTNSQVAIKILLVPQQETSLERFRREALVGTTLRHRNLVRVLDAGMHGHVPFIVMEHVEGESLDHVLSRTGALPADRALEVLRDVAGGVAHVHERGFVHRDIKPSNILLDPSGRAMLSDFGVVLAMGGALSLTATGAIVGTPAFMAPEQVRGDKERIGPHTDVYALGATLYMALTGDPPALGGGADPPSAHDPTLPRVIDALVLRCLEQDVRRRFPDADTFLADVEQALEQVKRGSLPPRRSVLPAVVAAGAVLLALGLYLALGRAGGPSSTEAGKTASAEAKTPRPEPVEVETSARTEPEAGGPRRVILSGTRFVVQDAAGAELGRGTIAGERHPFDPELGYGLDLQGGVVGNVDDDPEPEVVVWARRVGSFPALIAIADSAGRIERRYWHPGPIMKLLLHDIDGDGIAEIYVAAINRRIALQAGPRTCLFSLDGRRMFGVAPPRLANGRRRTGTERWYAVVDHRAIGLNALRVEGAFLVAESTSTGRSTTIQLRPRQGGLFRRRLRIELSQEPRDVVIADLDGDGRRDLAVVVQPPTPKQEGALVFLHQTVSGRFAPQVGLPPRPSRFQAIAAGDIDGDGKVDLAVLSKTGVTRIYLRREGDKYELRSAKGLGPTGHDIAAIRLGKETAFVASWQGGQRGLQVIRWRNGRLRTADAQVPVPPGLERTWFSQLVVADWNGDGREDLVGLTRYTRRVFLWRQWTDGTLAFRLMSPPTQGKGVDGHQGAGLAVSAAHVAFTTQYANQGAAFLLPHTAQRGFYRGGPHKIEHAHGGGGRGIAILPRGEETTIAAAHFTGVLRLYSAQGGGARLVALEPGADTLVTGDIDGDGLQDLVVCNRDARTLSVFLSGPGR